MSDIVRRHNVKCRDGYECIIYTNDFNERNDALEDIRKKHGDPISITPAGHYDRSTNLVIYPEDEIVTLIEGPSFLSGASSK